MENSSKICILVSSLLVFWECSKTNTNRFSETTDTAQTNVYHASEDQNVALNLTRFDSLDLVAFNNQDTSLFYKFYDDTVLIAYPDGHETSGSFARVKDLKALFEQMPDLKILSHLIKFGSGDWTCVTGMITGSSSKPTLEQDGKKIQPTGKNFVIPFCSIAHWKNHLITEQRIYWDNETMKKQMAVPANPQ